MRYLVILGIFTLLFLGCTGTSPSTNVSSDHTNCRLVDQSTPVTKQECSDLSTTEPICSFRKVNYTSSLAPRIDLCASDACTGNPLGSCPNCSWAMSRCKMNVTNTDSKSATWTVAANFSLGKYGVIKQPISQTIDPNQSYIFDFYLMYSPGTPINSASCNLAVVSDPTVQDCIQQTRKTTECKNVTTMVIVQKQV
ncbi:hypothetical protein HZC07_02480, partial [Candidatus Micrarchaeota archaeon]|nr:hypothetical protein [Candidatus Micrarchaeota archaeon]